ncbi:MAG: hypothetical protein IJV89_10780 [Lentisphaeria bacterium]|nr:hypothetical protein [Lentisphaeria bacterium]
MDAFLVFLSWSLFGSLVGLSAARAKGLGTAAGIIAGFFLGPLAVLMFLCSDNKKKCIYCAEWIEKNAMVCCYCGRAQSFDSMSDKSTSHPTPPPPQTSPVSWSSNQNCNAHDSQPQPEIKEKRIPCPFCGEAILEIAKKCRYCGSMLSQLPRPPIPPPLAIKVKCPFCNQKLSIEISDAGNEFCCPQCNNIFRLEISEN